jgi:ATP-binding cassette subfamily B protein
MAIHTDAEKETKRGQFGYSDFFLYKFMFSYMSPFKKQLVVTFILIVIFSITTILGPLILLNAINELQLRSSFTVIGIPFIDNYFNSIINFVQANYFSTVNKLWLDILALTIVYLLVNFIGFYVAYKQNIIVGTIGLLATKKIREDLFRQLQELDMSYHDKNEVGRIMSRVTSDVEAIRQFFGGAVIENLMNLLTVITVSLVIWFIDPVLSLFTYILMPVIVILSLLQKKYGRPLHKEARRTNSILMAYLGESIQGIKVTKGMNREEKNEDIFAKLNKNKTEADMRSRNMAIRFFSSMLFIQSLSVAIIIFVGGIRYLDGFVTVGVIFAFLNYNLILFRPVIILGNFYEQLQNALTGSERIYALLSTKTNL